MLNNVDVANTEIDYTDNAFMALVNLRGNIIKDASNISKGKQTYAGFADKSTKAVKNYKERFLMSNGRLMDFDKFTPSLVQLVDNFDPLKPMGFLNASYKMIIKMMPSALAD